MHTLSLSRFSSMCLSSTSGIVSCCLETVSLSRVQEICSAHSSFFTDQRSGRSDMRKRICPLSLSLSLFGSDHLSLPDRQGSPCERRMAIIMIMTSGCLVIRQLCRESGAGKDNGDGHAACLLAPGCSAADDPAACSAFLLLPTTASHCSRRN